MFVFVSCLIVLEIDALQQGTLLIRVRDMVMHSTQSKVSLSGNQKVFTTCGQCQSLSSAQTCPQYRVNKCCLRIGMCLSWLGLFAVVLAFGSRLVWGRGLEQSRDITLSLSLFALMSTAMFPRDAVLVIFRADPILWHHRLILSAGIGGHLAQYVLTPDRRVKLMRFNAETAQDLFLYSGTLGSRMVSTDCYRDVDSKHGPFLEPEIVADMRVAESRVRASEAIELPQTLSSPRADSSTFKVKRMREDDARRARWRRPESESGGSQCTKQRKICSFTDRTLGRPGTS